MGFQACPVICHWFPLLTDKGGGGHTKHLKIIEFAKTRCLLHCLLFLRNSDVISLTTENNDNVSLKWWMHGFKILNKWLKSVTWATIWNHRNSLDWNHHSNKKVHLKNLTFHFKVHVSHLLLKSNSKVALWNCYIMYSTL